MYGRVILHHKSVYIRGDISLNLKRLNFSYTRNIVERPLKFTDSIVELTSSKECTEIVLL